MVVLNQKNGLINKGKKLLIYQNQMNHGLADHRNCWSLLSWCFTPKIKKIFWVYVCIFSIILIIFIHQQVRCNSVTNFYLLFFCSYSSHQVLHSYMIVLSMIDKEDPTIIQVSTISGTHQGSIEGETILVIKGTSFNPDYSKNVIWVGPYPCTLMADGST